MRRQGAFYFLQIASHAQKYSLRQAGTAKRVSRFAQLEAQDRRASVAVSPGGLV